MKKKFPLKAAALCTLRRPEGPTKNILTEQRWPEGPHSASQNKNVLFAKKMHIDTRKISRNSDVIKMHLV